MKTLWMALCVLTVTAVIPAGVLADCSPATGVMMNEMRFYDADSPFGNERIRSFVELYNKSGSPVDVTGWQLSNVDGLLGIQATLPSVTIPAESFLILWFATGTDDLDFSDTIGNVYTNGDSMEVFAYQEDGIGLYDDLGNMLDYVTWSENGAAPAGSGLSDALTAGVWTAADYIPTVAGDGEMVTWRLLPDGYDFHRDRDWHNYGWGDSNFGSGIDGPNRMELSPSQGTGIEADSLVVLNWGRPNIGSNTYRVQVSTDSTFAGGHVLDVTTTGTDTTLSLGEDVYHWRVSLIDTCGEVGGGSVAFEVFATSAAPGLSGLAELKYVAVNHYWQHKDSKLLCIYDNGAVNRRPGCTESASAYGPWDAPHPTNHAEFTIVAGAFHTAKYNCHHCRNYCARASVQMINHKFGGDLTQDRIAYEFMKLTPGTDPSPEGDLGHDLPVPVASAKPVLQWAVKNTTVTGPFWNNHFAGIKQTIDNGFPVFVAKPGHAMVVDAYIERNSWSPGRPSRDMIRVRNPWPTKNYGWRWVNDGEVNLMAHWKMAKTGAANGVGQTQEATVTTDTDGDGMMDFDEGAPNYPADRPRKFHSRHTTQDTDLDDVTDKIEVRSYTFYSCGNNNSITFPDIDNDGLRAEGDCDSDHKLGTGCFDGGEDIHDTGQCLDRSDPFDFNDDIIFAVTNKFLYLLGEEVKMAGSYMHADTTYPYDIIPSCPTLVNGQPLAHDGNLSSNSSGVIPFQTITICTEPGLYLGVIDILRNQICEKGPCENPDACWICMIPTFQGDDDDSADWEDPTGTNNNPLGAAWQAVPDNWFDFTGVSWGIDAFWVPTQPVDAVLRTKPITVQTQGDLVFLTFQHEYYGMEGLQGTVRMSADGGNTWDVLFQFTPGNDVQGWESIEITEFLTPSLAPGLNQPAIGPDIILEFWATSPPAGGAWFVDNVFVGETPAEQVGIPDEETLPTEMFLTSNYPNPFKAQTTIRFSLPAEAGKVTVDILDVNGRRIHRLVNGELPAGSNLVTWDGHDALGRQVATGIYFYRLKSNFGTLTKKMTLIK